MKNITFYHSCINEHGHTKNKRTKSDKHNLRFEHNIDNVLNENSKNNLLYINNVKVKPTDNENNFNTVQNILNNLKKDFVSSANTNDDNLKLSNTRKTELQTKRTKLKFKIKKWADNDKAEEQEKQFWREIDQKLGDEKLEPQPLIEELQSQGKAVKRFNDKRKALNGLEELNALIGTTSRNTSLKIISKELLYKIPDKNEVHIKPQHWIKITNAIHKELYKDFDVIYSTVHTDEQSPHLHARISGKNNITGEFDIQDQLLNRIRELHPEKLPDEKKYCELSAEEVQKFGKLYQTTVFSRLNQALQKLGYDDIKAKKRSKEEKKNDFEKFKDSKKPIADRQFNMQKQLLEKNEELKESNTDLESSNEALMKNKSELEENNKSLLDNNSNLKNNNNKLIKKKNSNIKEIKATNKKIDSLNEEKNKLTNFLNRLNEDFAENFNKVYNFYKTEPFKKLVDLFNTKVLAINDYKYNEDIHSTAKFHFRSFEKNRDDLLEELKKANPDLFEQKLKEEQEKRLVEERQREELNKRALEEERKHEEEQRNRRSWFSKPKTSKRKNSRNDSLRRP